MTRPRAWSVDDIRELGVVTDLETAGSVFGVGRTTSYELARAGAFPCKVLRLGHKYVVPVRPMLEALGLADPGPPTQAAEALEDGGPDAA